MRLVTGLPARAGCVGVGELWLPSFTFAPRTGWKPVSGSRNFADPVVTLAAPSI